ncbi:MAG: APC family permease [Actinomycetales bacterium]
MADKGLKADSVGLFGGVLLGISSVAPAYVLTATLGLLAMAVGEKTPVVIIAGFLPMFFAAYAYREFNRVMPDSGTSFTWTTKAFGPYIGWIGGWTAVVATIIVLSNLAGVAVQFLYQFIGSATGSATINDLWQNKAINVVTCLVFLAIATYIAYRGIDTTERVQGVLVIFQMIMLVALSAFAFARHETTGVGADFSWSWFDPTGISLSAFVVGLSGSIFGFWGWDTSLTVNEESKDSDHGPGLAALLCVVSILITYLMVAISTQMFAGLGDTGLGLRNEQVSDNVFGNLAEPILGSGLALLLYLAVLASSAASLITTFLPTSRTLLAMGAYGAMPASLARLHPKYKTPVQATVLAGVGAGIFYTVMTLLSERVLTDTILSIGIMICLYYGLVAFGCVWFFRGMLFDSLSNVIFKFLFPLLGGIGLFFVLIVTLRDSADPAYGSGAAVFGVGLVLVLGVGLILAGLVLMFYMRATQPAFFRNETLTHEPAHLMKPGEHLDY